MQKVWKAIGVVSIFTLSAVPAGAGTIDLINGNSGSSNGALYEWMNQQSVGTGVFEPFVRIQGNGEQQGYNTDFATNAGGGNPWETKPGTWTHDLTVADLVTKTIDGISYYEFALDINQNKGGSDPPNSYLSLNNVQIYTRSTQILDPEEDLTTLGMLRFNNDVGADGDTTVNLDFVRNPGSGAGDMLMYVPTSLFNGAADTDYVYFYSHFGDPNYESNDGFEEWALLEQEDVPDFPDGGTTLSLLGLAMLGVGYLRRRIQ